MKVLLSWLREFAPFEGDPLALADQMSDLGMAVESIERIGAGLDGIVVARVLDLRPHPNADKIQLVDVDAGDGEPLQICCGAFNMAVGDLVPLATIGTTMPNGLEIERRKLRGEWSNGMLCSASELGFGDDHSGIYILPQDLEPGTDLKEALGITEDVLYDLEINPNRPDAMSVAGVARDLAARLRIPFTQLDPKVSETGDSSGLIGVEIVDPDLCGRFYARVLRDVAVGESPSWLANRLVALGMRPINSIVDISNYVMLELGQPNHTYDLDLVPGGQLRVRWAREGERIVTLDDVERELTPVDGVIADRDDRPIGIAGVMGGASTEISAQTTSVLLEMAWWQPMAIARSSARLGLRSEASMRFERGADPEVVELAARRFAELAAASGATLLGGAVDERGELPSREPIIVRTQRINALLGTTLEGEEIRDLLEPIGFEFTEAADGPDAVQAVRIPSFRYDTATETDVAEEVARHHGYGRIAKTIPASPRIGGLSERQIERRLVRQVLVGLGIDEAMPSPFLSPGSLAGVPHVSIANPLAAAESALRPSLQPGLLQAVAYNASHRNFGVQLFEIGKVWHPAPPQEPLPIEREMLGVAMSRADARAAADVLFVLGDALALWDLRLNQVPVEGLHPTRSAEVIVAGSIVGCVGEVHPDRVASVGLDDRVGWIELDLDLVASLPHGERRYRPVSRFPSTDLDVAFEVAESTPAAEVEQVIRDAAGELLTSIHLFDVYRGDQVAPGTRSLAFTLRLQAPDRTLTDADAAEVRAAVISAVETRLPAKLRG